MTPGLAVHEMPRTTRDKQAKSAEDTSMNVDVGL
jgi:hypothetical protein